VPERYTQTSAIKLLPLGIPQVLVIGEHEDFVPRPLAEVYAQAAEQAGDPVRLIVIPRVGHFEIASPRASPWPQVESAIRALLDGKLPPEGGTTTESRGMEYRKVPIDALWNHLPETARAAEQ
jgi:acetyl esterase/lipase